MSEVDSATGEAGAQGGLVAQLRELCADTLGRLAPGPGRRMVEAVDDRLRAPLTVTVAGGVSSGKSTLVNALLGQRIAAVDAGECTRVVTEFRFGAYERAEVIGVDGSTSVVALDRGRMPEHLGRPPEQIDRVVVHLSNALLRDLAVVDTPGINTTSEANAATSARFLGITDREGAQTAAAVGRAEALVFLLPVLRKADADVLRGFASLLGGTTLSAASSVAVLSKVDRLDRSTDPVTAARPIAARMAAELRGVVSEVVPVVGLVAETARAGVFTEADARALQAVAAVDDPIDRDDLFLSPEDFLRSDLIDLDVAVRRRLLAMLDLAGLQIGVEAIDAGARTAAALLEVLERRSGFDALRTAVIGRFAGRAEVFKAQAALADLRRATYLQDDPANAPALRALRGPLERIELDGSMHQLRVLQLASAVASGDLQLPAELFDDVVAIGGDDHSPISRADAAARAARWATWGADPRRSPEQARGARVMKTAYELRWERART
ncbi:MAG: dynamin family protein [Acidimicrobiales bacterium]